MVCTGIQNVPEAAPDIADYASVSVRRALSDADKYSLANKSSDLRPDYRYKYPGRDEYGKQRRFQFDWLQRFNWLVYSKRENGGYCLPCMLFGRGQDGGDLGILVSRPMINFTKALSTTLPKHEQKESHQMAVTRLGDFLAVMDGKRQDVHHHLDTALAQQVATNRLKLEAMVDTVLLCGRQNIALRGHRDSSTDVEADSTANNGNFLAILDYAVKRGDKVLGDHLHTAAGNATYTSGKMQNQFIDIIGDHIRSNIINKVKSAKWFTVIADEVTDVSNKEQLSLVLRYVNPDDGLLREDLVDFIECQSGISGQALSDMILAKLGSYGLELSLMRGQCYDGAGNMSGINVGASTLITNKYPLALYLHCASHCLNLAVVSGLENTLVRNMMGVVRRAGTFFDAHPKRQLALEKAINETQPAANKKKLGDLCRTRWVQRLDALEAFQQLHSSVVACMESICEAGPRYWSTDSVTDAKGLLLSITASDFISALVVTNKCLGYLRALTCSLQAEAKDVVQAVGEIDVVIASLNDVRTNIDAHHGNWFEEIEQICHAVDVVPALPRRCGRQRHRDNTPADEPVTYYRRCISVPLVDHLVVELERRFSPHHCIALLGLCLVPSALVTLPDQDVKGNLAKLVEQYEEDLPSPASVSSQLHSWKIKWQEQMRQHGKACLPNSPSQALPHATTLYPDIRVLLLVLCTLPVTSCSSERSFSSLKRIKTYLRSSCGNERLTSLALMHIHRDVPVSSMEIVDKFARLHPRRLQLVNLH